MTNDWRPIPSAPNYLASAAGEIRHKDATAPRKPRTDKRGYCYVSMWIGGNFCNRTVHSLVAEAFHGPRPDGSQVCHRDGNPGHNSEDNLRYGTALDNAADREEHGNTKRGEFNGNARLSDDDAYSLKVLYLMGLMTQRQAAKMFKISQAQVNNIVLGKQRQRAA